MFGLPHILGIGKAFFTLTYLLRTDFSQWSGSLSNGNVLNAGGGDAYDAVMIEGSLTVRDTSTGVLSIDGSSRMAIVGPTTGAWDTTGLSSSTAVAREDGRVFKARRTPSAIGSGYSGLIGLGNTSDVMSLATRKLSFTFGSSGTGYVHVAGSDYQLFSYTATDYDIAIVLRTTGAYFFIKGGTFSTWTLIHVDSSEATANLYAHLQAYQSGFTAYLYSMKATETLYPNLVATVAEDDFSVDGALVGSTPDKGSAWESVRADAGSSLTVSSGTAKVTATTAGAKYCHAVIPSTGASDVLITADMVTASTLSNSVNLLSGRVNGTPQSVGADNNAIFGYYYHNGSSGSIYIDEIVDGVSANRGSSAFSASASTAYAAQMRLVGSSATWTFGGTTITGALSTPKTHQKHGIQLYDTTTVTGSTCDNFKVYPATGYDEVLDAI